MTGATVGMAFDMHVIPESLLVYVSALPTLISEVGVIKDGAPISYDDMREMIRREILWVYADADVNYSTGRVELTVEASGSDRLEAEKALEWLRLKLFHPDWRPDNLPRIRDAIDLSLQNTRNTMKGSEEAWVHGPADAYWKQTNSLILAADCFLTRAHAMQRIRWMLKEAASDAIQMEFSRFMNELGSAAVKLDRSGLEALLSVISGGADDPIGSPINDAFTSKHADLSDETRELVSDAVQDLRQNLGEVPDATLAKDWRYLCARIASDLEVSPREVLSDLEYLMNLVRREDNVRSWVVSSSLIQETVLPMVRDVAAELSDEPSERQQYDTAPLVKSRLAEHAPGSAEPVYVGLVNENTQNGVFINYAGCARFKDFDREGLLDFLAARLYGGGGAHSMFMKTWSAGLAYSNGLRSSEFSGRLTYCAERCPDLAQTMQFVVNELESAPYDPRLADYAVAQAFQASRAGSNYENRGEAMAANLADGITPEVVRNFREAVLELAKGSELYDELQEPSLYDELRPRMLPVYGRVLPGIDPPGVEVGDALYFIIGPEKQFESFEEYLHGTEGESTVYRLYPRDYWLVETAVN
jgi:Zn-dependent M16 (insulinase) family peptidase